MTQHIHHADTSAADPACEVLLARTIEAPRASVFRAWTDPGILAEWWGPHAVTIPVCELDARKHGQYRIILRDPDGIDYPVHGTFHEFIEPEQLVMTLDLSTHPAAWHERLHRLCPDTIAAPLGELLLTVTFTPSGEHTLLTVRTSFQTPALRNAFLELGMRENWNESLDSLSALLPHL